MEFSRIEKQEILNLALQTLPHGHNIIRSIEDFDFILDKPSLTTLCSIRVQSRIAELKLHVHLFITRFTYNSFIDRYVNSREIDPWAHKESTHIACSTLHKDTFQRLHNYILSPDFFHNVIMPSKEA